MPTLLSICQLLIVCRVFQRSLIRMGFFPYAILFHGMAPAHHVCTGQPASHGFFPFRKSLKASFARPSQGMPSLHGDSHGRALVFVGLKVGLGERREVGSGWHWARLGGKVVEDKRTTEGAMAFRIHFAKLLIAAVLILLLCGAHSFAVRRVHSDLEQVQPSSQDTVVGTEGRTKVQVKAPGHLCPSG
ncbi:MAG: hypothetical protein J3Q66DRAFT_352022 [Benniella sp.]|nr:MAG: hypothetical protein J3Q66DRAFT_352022 [Benniella sp.]